MVGISLTDSERSEISAIANSLIQEGANLDPPHANIWSIPGSISTSWCPWASVDKDDWESELKPDHVERVWPSERIEEILEGGGRPTADEIDAWHRAYCTDTAKNYSETVHVWIAPMTAPSGASGYVVFETSTGYPDDPPQCIGVLATLPEAKALIEKDGAIRG